MAINRPILPTATCVHSYKKDVQSSVMFPCIWARDILGLHRSIQRDLLEISQNEKAMPKHGPSYSNDIEAEDHYYI